MEIECKQCGKKFNAEDALKQHEAAKHSVEEKQKTKLPVKKMLAYFFAALALAAILYFMAIPPPKTTYTPLLEDSAHVKGSPDAAIAIVEYSDFQCPFCKKAVATLDQLLEEYDGKVKLEYRHLPVPSHEFAFKAAEASECAADQGKFWEYHDILFERQPSLSENSLKRYAAGIGLNATLFEACLGSGVMSPRVRADAEEAAKARVSSTPTFFINGKKVVGAQPIEQFRKVIDEELK